MLHVTQDLRKPRFFLEMKLDIPAETPLGVQEPPKGLQQPSRPSLGL